MRIGITFDLRDDYAGEGFDDEQTAEFDSIETIVAIEAALHSLGHATERIGRAQALVQRLADGERWGLVFNIGEGMHGFGRQALIPSLLDSYGIPYTFSDPLALCVTLHKPTAKRIVRDHGLRTPDFLVVERLEDVGNVTAAFPLFIKPVAEGTSKGISPASRVTDMAQLRAGCRRLLARHRQPVLVEAFLPGREFTVGILGTGADAQAIGAMELLMLDAAEADIYSYENKQYFEERVRVRLATDAAGTAVSRLALSAWMALGCRDAGRIDIRLDRDGNASFLEANPLAGLHPTHSDLPLLGQLAGIAYVDLIDRIVVSALTRAGIGTPHPVTSDRHHDTVPP